MGIFSFLKPTITERPYVKFSRVPADDVSSETVYCTVRMRAAVHRCGASRDLANDVSVGTSDYRNDIETV